MFKIVDEITADILATLEIENQINCIQEYSISLV